MTTIKQTAHNLAQRIEDSVLPYQVYRSVIEENYAKRCAEAAEAVIPPDENKTQDYAEVMQEAIRAEQKSTEERAELFYVQFGEHLSAFEIYVRMREGGDMLDRLFAVNCLERLARRIDGTVEAATDTEDSLPKVVRPIEVDEIDSRKSRFKKFSVVTAKSPIGSLTHPNGMTAVLRSRQAGVLLVDTLDIAEQGIVEGLANYPRQRGSTNELRQARQELDEILRQNQSSVVPIIESGYLAKTSQ